MAAVSSCTAMYCGSGYYAEQGAFHAPRPATRARSTGNAAVDTGLSYRASTFSAFSGKRTRKRRKRPPGAQQRGSHILTNTGLYGAAGGRYIPDFAFSATAEDLAARWTREFQATWIAYPDEHGFVRCGGWQVYPRFCVLRDG